MDFQSILLGALIIGAIFFLFGGNGILASLIALIPPVRSAARNSVAARSVIILALGLLAFAITFLMWTRLQVEVSFVFTNIVSCVMSDEPALPEEIRDEKNRSIIARELWVRAMFPPLLSKFCYTADANTCRIVAEALKSREFSSLATWRSYLVRAALSALSMLIGVGLSWLFTRPKRETLASEENRHYRP